MKTDKIFWGIILVYVGAIFLLENFDIIDFSWMYVWKFWPFLLIIAGVNILLSRRNSKAGLIIIVVITLVGLSLITYKGLQPHNNDSWWTYSDDEENRSDSSKTEEISTSYTEEYDDRFKIASLEINTGASDLVIEETTAKLFEADIIKTSAPYILKKTDNDSTVYLEFETKSQKKFNFKKNNFGKVNMSLNDLILWDLNLNMGAGKAEFDLENVKVRNINLKGGAAKFDIKLGSLVNQVNLSAETGVASVDIKVPESTGCRISNSSGLSAKKFQGFKKISDGNYETPNFKTATSKISIVLKGGLSDFEVSRY